jgi:hypothetical protein
MKAELLMRERLILSRRAFVEIVIWDNEAGKGDHKHLDEIEVRYIFSNLDTLQADFWAAVNKRRKGK